MSRIITAAVVLPILIASILISWLQPLFVLLAAAAMVLGLYEFWTLARRRQMKPDETTGYLAAAGLFTVFYFADPAPDRGLDTLTLLLIVLALTVIVLIACTLRGSPF